MFLALLTLLISLVISGVAVFYSVSGLAAIFSAAAVPIIIMGASLEIGKLITALWLHRNWKAAPLVLKSYFAIATLVLMFVTSIGIFGFLSRAHIEQTAGIGTVGVQIEQLNLDIRLEQDKIDNNRKIITQLDAAVNNLLQGSATQSQQTRANSAQQASNLATQATRLRQQQNAERTRLQTEITAASNRIADLNRQKLQLDQQIRNIETEVGPIKYIAQFVYGTQARSDKELLEKAVTWLILIIIFVFDPLAVLLLIASQISFHHAMQARREKKLAKEAKKNHVEPQITIPNSENLPLQESKVSAFPVPVNSQITDSVTQSLPLVDNKVSEAAPVVKDPLPRPTTPRKKKEKIIEQSIPDLEVLPVPETKPEPEQPKKKESYIMRKGAQQIKVEKKLQ